MMLRLKFMVKNSIYYEVLGLFPYFTPSNLSLLGSVDPTYSPAPYFDIPDGPSHKLQEHVYALRAF